MMQTMHVSPQAQLEDFYESIARDCETSIIHMLGEAGCGKSSSLRSIIQYVREKHPDIVWKIFDVSQSHYHQSPLPHRQLVTLDKVMKQRVSNLDNCVYELGSMSKQQRRMFIGEIMKSDYEKRYKAKLEGRLGEYPLMMYVVEECDVIFGSYSMRINDAYTPVFQQFVSVGRNYLQRGFLLSTAEQGEVAPSLRKRTRKIYGRIINKQDIAAARRSGITADLTKLPRFSFHYQGITQRIPDSCHTVPQDHIVQSPVHTQQQGQFDSKWFMTFFSTLAIFLIFWASLMRL